MLNVENRELIYRENIDTFHQDNKNDDIYFENLFEMIDNFNSLNIRKI